MARLIDRALRSGACWIAAPAGYGKTTATADYLANAAAPHVWFRVDEGDQDIAKFFGYLAQSLPSAEAVSKMPVFGVEYADDVARLRPPVLSGLLCRVEAGRRFSSSTTFTPPTRRTSAAFSR